MFSVKSRVDVLVRVVIIASVLFNALAPIPALAKPATNVDIESVDETVSELARSLPEQNQLYFDPPLVEQPQRRSPDPGYHPKIVWSLHWLLTRQLCLLTVW